MISVTDALSSILSHRVESTRESVDIRLAVGRILAEAIYADRDLPPFSRATMDGIAISSAAFDRGRRDFKIQSSLAAGQPSVRLANGTGCVEIMTGAVVPEGADCIIRYEDLKIADGIASVQIDAVTEGDFIHRQGQDAKKNDSLLSAGVRISPAEVALLASVGKANVTVFSFPRTAVVSTGDELVAIDQVPLPHQIRYSNALALQAALHEMKCNSTHFHIADDRALLRERLAEILSAHELVILSGGVSRGKHDFVPTVLESLGIRKIFHQVQQRPGKPLWFGASDRQTVFGLPGNPVSTYLCFYKYIKPWLLSRMNAGLDFPTAVLASDFLFSAPLTYFLQVKITNKDGMNVAWPDAGGGSGDFANLRSVDGFLELPDGGRLFRAGEVFSFIPFRYF